jgi:hypothetical protein
MGQAHVAQPQPLGLTLCYWQIILLFVVIDYDIKIKKKKEKI